MGYTSRGRCFDRIKKQLDTLNMPLVIIKFLIHFMVSIIAGFGGHFIIFPIVEYMKNESGEDCEKKWLPAWVGRLERMGYVFSWLLGLPQFIALWLTLKVAGGWKAWEKEKKGRIRFQQFLIGSIISVFIAVFVALCDEWLISKLAIEHISRGALEMSFYSYAVYQALQIFALVCMFLGSVILTVPLLKREEDIDNDEIIGDRREDKDGKQKYFYTRKSFLRDRKIGLYGLGLMALGFLIQLISAIEFFLR